MVQHADLKLLELLTSKFCFLCNKEMTFEIFVFFGSALP